MNTLQFAYLLFDDKITAYIRISQQCSRIRILRFFEILKNMTFLKWCIKNSKKSLAQV